MGVYGYARVSTKTQVIDRQVSAIERFSPDAIIFSEKYTGTTSYRPEWKKLKERVFKERSSGLDVTIIFDSVSRMSRNAEDGINDYFEFFNAGINLVFLNERYVDTSVYRQALNIATEMPINANGLLGDILDITSKYQAATARKQIEIAFEQAEKEVLDLRKRTKAGMAVKNAGAKISKARTGKKYASKKSIETKKIILKHSIDFGGTLLDKDLIKFSGVSRNTYYKYKNELYAEALQSKTT